MQKKWLLVNFIRKPQIKEFFLQKVYIAFQENKIDAFGQPFECKKGWLKPTEIEAEKEIDKEKGKEEKKKKKKKIEEEEEEDEEEEEENIYVLSFKQNKWGKNSDYCTGIFSLKSKGLFHKGGGGRVNI